MGRAAQAWGCPAPSLFLKIALQEKVAPDYTNVCHCSFAKLMYGKRKKPKQSGTLGGKKTEDPCAAQHKLPLDIAQSRFNIPAHTQMEFVPTDL